MTDIAKSVHNFLADPDHQRFGGRASELLRELLTEVDNLRSVRQERLVLVKENQQLRAKVERLRGLLEDVKGYMERVEEQIDGEWGDCLPAQALIDSGAMPELYNKVIAAIGSDTDGLPTSTA